MLNKLSIGSDIVKIDRIKRLFETSASEKVFLPSELRKPSLPHLAGIFAAKEAAIKALSLPAGHWLDIEVSNDESGKPRLSILNPHLQTEALRIEVTISHEDEYAIAFVLVMQND